MTLHIAVGYDSASSGWYATADKGGRPQWDTGGEKCTSPEAALYVLAMVLYRELEEADSARTWRTNALIRLKREVDHVVRNWEDGVSNAGVLIDDLKVALQAAEVVPS